jgi:BirA family biotin operon repressor/biotin-[acetyl-CoA-carboxylase] ligase
MIGKDASPEEAIRPEAVLSALVDRAGPAAMLRHVEAMECVTSTNAIALDDQREGLLLLAREQTWGRGRHSSHWVSPPGGLYLSYVPPVEHLPSRATDLSLIAALAVANALEVVLEAAGLPDTRSLLKWPNDVLMGEGKVAGVLLQSRGNVVAGGDGVPRTVVGIGINVNARIVIDPPEERPPDEWPVAPRSLCDLVGRDLDLEPILVEVMVHLLSRLSTGLDDAAMDEYRSRCITLGKRVALTEGGKRLVGTARDVSRDGGALIVDLGDGEIREIRAGDVRHIRAVQG